MDRKKIEEALLAKAKPKEGKLYINCKDAIKIAEDIGVAPIETGKVCNELKIKINNCKLGCF
jgi:hypothetical protein